MKFPSFSEEQTHNVIVGAVLVLAVVIVWRHRTAAVPAGVVTIDASAGIAPSEWSPPLPGYVTYNRSPWGPSMQPMIPNSGLSVGGANSGQTGGIYGGYYNR
jgi:hypothetical protein